jgi:N-sulfoglucosamine sulfohydrolase
VGELLATLEKSGKASNTLVIYIGDHGADFLRGKRTCYEGGLRIPLIIRWPGKAKPQVRDELVSTIDLMPTVLAACGAAPVPDLPGMPLQPLLSNDPVSWRTQLFAEYHTHAAASNYHPQRSVRTERFKLIENLQPDKVNPDYADTIRKLEGDAKGRSEIGFADSLPQAIAASPEVRAAYAVMEKPPRYELYDLQNDPHEFHNLAADPARAATLTELQTQLTAWREQTTDPLLDPQNLTRLTAEVSAVKSKSEGRQLIWGYPDYFFGKEPATPTSPSKPSKKKKKKP